MQTRSDGLGRSLALACALLTGASAGAFAQPAGQGGGAAAREFTASVERLRSPNPSEVQAGLEALGLSGNPRAVAPIAARIRRGLPPAMLSVAIDTLTILGRPEAGPVLVTLANHRRAEVRLAAVQGIAATNPPSAAAALIHALSDSDPRVRAAAAQGIASTGATGAIDSLFLALDRDEPEAAIAIGHVARPTDVARFLTYLGGHPFEVVRPALSEMLDREDLADRAKLTIVHALAELATSGARELLEGYVQRGEADTPSLRAAREALPRMEQ